MGKILTNTARCLSTCQSGVATVVVLGSNFKFGEDFVSESKVACKKRFVVGKSISA